MEKNNDITYTFSQDDINKLNDYLNSLRDLVYYIGENYDGVLDEMADKADGDFIMINALITAIINNN